MKDKPEKLLITLDPDKHPDELLALAEQAGLPTDLSIPSVREQVWEMWLAEQHLRIEEWRRTLPPGTELVILQAELHGEDTDADTDADDPVMHARNVSYAAAAARLSANSGRMFPGYRPILVERNILNWPPAMQRLEATVAAWRQTDPDVQVLVLEMPEPPIAELLGERRNEVLDYTAGDASLTETGKAARADLAALAKKLDALETLRSSMSPQEVSRLQEEILAELARIRSAEGREIVHNEPKKWIRTAANDSDLLLQYMLDKENVKYFGILVYTDLDKNVIEFVRSNWDAIDQITGPAFMVFAFENVDRLLSRNRILAHHAVLTEHKSRIARTDGLEIVSELPDVQRIEQSILEHTFTRNDSVQVARRLGVRQEQVPCLLIFSPAAEDDVVVYNFPDEWARTGELTAHLRRVVDILEASAATGKTSGIRRQFRSFRARKWLKRNVSSADVMEAVKMVAEAAVGG